ncbi:MAG TPA: MFS transporter [Pirellulaceae bacterium]|nr:MFS transporter [Pirellulaceae bacterium]
MNKQPPLSSASASTTAAPREPRGGSLLVIFLTVFVDLLGFGMVLPLLPIYAKYIAAEHGYSNLTVGALIGLLMSSFSIMQFIFVPIWGRLSDRYGRRPILMLGLAGSTFFYTCFGIATMYQSLLGLFICRIGAGIAGATISTAQAYIADTTTKEKRNKGMALIGAAFALGFTLGPMLGIVALLAGGNVTFSPWPGLVAAGFSGVALLLAIFVLPESLRGESQRAEQHLFDRAALVSALSTPSVGLLLLTSFIALFSFANFETTLSLQVAQLIEEMDAGGNVPTTVQAIVNRAKGWGYDQPEEIKLFVICAVFAYLGIVLTFAQGFLVRRLAGKIHEGSMAIGGGVLAIVGFLLLGWAAESASFNLLLVAMSVEVVGFSLVSPSLQSLISRRSDPHKQGGILGIAQSSASLSRILGPMFGNVLFARSAAWPYWAATGLMILAVLLMLPATRGGSDYPGTK